jgi:N-acetylglutamate synthase
MELLINLGQENRKWGNEVTKYMQSSINFIEELSLNAFPSLQTHLYDGWISRFTNGITLRGNSISPLYPGSIDYVKKIAYCEEMFNSHGLPIAYRVTENTDKKLDVLLEDNGYIYENQINTMLCDLSKQNFQNTGVSINYELTERWLYGVFKDCSDEKRIFTHLECARNGI